MHQKPIDLLDLTPETDVEVLVNEIVRKEDLISESRKPQLRKLIFKLIEKIDVADVTQNFYLFKILRAHILPLTNCAFNKSGDRFITGSYDRTCKVWNTLTGEELLTLEGHKNVVYAIAFNNPFGDKIVTGSFDKTAKIWNAETGAPPPTARAKLVPKPVQSPPRPRGASCPHASPSMDVRRRPSAEAGCARAPPRRRAIADTARPLHRDRLPLV